MCLLLLQFSVTKCSDCINSRQRRPDTNITYRQLVLRLVSQDILFCGAQRVHVLRHATQLPLLACSDSRLQHDQQAAVTWGEKLQLSRACLTPLTQTISSIIHASVDFLHTSHMLVRMVKSLYFTLFWFNISAYFCFYFFYLVAVDAFQNERNYFVGYSKILQHWMHRCVYWEIR